MKVVIAGSRIITQKYVVDEAIRQAAWDITEVVSGGARGVDALGEIWARRNKVKVKRFPADWKRFGPAAGLLRNKLMVDYAEAVIAVWDGESPGTDDTIKRAKQRRMPVFVMLVNRQEKTYSCYRAFDEID